MKVKDLAQGPRKSSVEMLESELTTFQPVSQHFNHWTITSPGQNKISFSRSLWFLEKCSKSRKDFQASEERYVFVWKENLVVIIL